MTTNPSVADLRKDYRSSTLDRTDVCDDPIKQFQRWWQEVLAANIPEPNGMTLATATPDGHPSARIVLLKGFDQRGFCFFTNYTSRKGNELTANPHAALVFWWEPLERQVRIEGTVEKMATDESDTYFNSRPKGSRIGAWASPQSQVIGDRQVLEESQTALENEYANQDNIPRPPHWGGFRLVPTQVEFWQGRSSRLHDRICYTKKMAASHSTWNITRLAP
ncbi:MAG: pyridoxamine 5'-phosphate oxidase [Merismopedia sp. SIO2A8]|nr:pyridoxamine 5'-phosphate oxidase [Merismopedia sp. SIO2A8]